MSSWKHRQIPRSRCSPASRCASTNRSNPRSARLVTAKEPHSRQPCRLRFQSLDDNIHFSLRRNSERSTTRGVDQRDFLKILRRLRINFNLSGICRRARFTDQDGRGRAAAQQENGHGNDKQLRLCAHRRLRAKLLDGARVNGSSNALTLELAPE